MTWLMISYQCRAEYLDDLRDLLEIFGAVSVSYQAASPEPVFDDDCTDCQYWDLNEVSAMFSIDLDVDILTACVRNRLGVENVSACKIESLADKNWTEQSQSNFKAMHFGNNLCICPSWHDKPEDVTHVVELDPGLAFGTGSHATTALCLEWLTKHNVSGLKIIDYGCGSGILAISAAKLGAQEVSAIDTDEQAVTSTISNARKNHVDDRIQCGLPGKIELVKADVLFANILLKPLQELSTNFSSLLLPGGQIVLSGVLVSQVSQLMESYRSWIEFESPVFRDEWVMISGRNRLAEG
jgi:ribosomal protein L11 methyltransferase